MGCAYTLRHVTDSGAIRLLEGLTSLSVTSTAKPPSVSGVRVRAGNARVRRAKARLAIACHPRGPGFTG
jgi:hypothetical protein